ncbi:hypothetical protein NX059_006851 [Plenodomus lindquistii]|nr:hypothetical protein NX059_006851 [Plenodomus lindquistii]
MLFDCNNPSTLLPLLPAYNTTLRRNNTKPKPTPTSNMSAIRAFATRRSPFIIQRAAFSQSITRGAGKESALHSENRAEEVEKKKQEQLQKQKDGKGHWEEELASDGEAAVKADRAETGKEDIKDMQKAAEKVAKK